MDTATVLFTDLVDSTGTRGRIGDDAADALRRVHDKLVGDSVARHDGTVVKGLGDGVMATFASAADGVGAAVDIQQTIAFHNTRQPAQPLSVRIGVSAGDVVREAGDCFGRPVIEAARLCAAADGGQIFVADVVRLLARQRGEHAFSPLGELTLRGLPEPLPASEVTWEPLTADVPAAALPMPELLESGTRLDFSGRDDELDVVVMAWKQSMTGERQAVLLAGEPGIGKTRLAREVGLRAHEQGGTVLYGRCEEDLGAPYQPFVEALDFFVQRSQPDALLPRLGRHPGELVRLVPALADLVPGLPPPLRSDAETERYRLFEAVASWLAATSDPGGIVLVLDDLHWATRPTLVLLQHVLHATSSSRLLVVGTYRDTDLDRAHPLAGLLADLRRSEGVARLALSGLDLDGVIRLVSHAAGHELDDNSLALATMIHAETEGNPFFVGEILRHLRESGTIYRQDGRWVSHLTAAEIGIPEGVRDVVGRRLDRLTQDANTALSTAAVIGRDFDLRAVSAVSALDEDHVVTGLEEAVEARLVEETGVGHYRFAHALVRSTLYDELSATRRARMHHKVAEFLEQVRPDDVATLAYHYGQCAVGDDLDKAVRYAKLAGDEAMDQLAHDRALDYYRQALELLEDEPRREESRCALLVSLGDAQRRSGDPEYRQTLLDAAALAQRLGSSDLLTQAALLNGRGLWSVAGEVDEERLQVLQAALDAVGDEDSADRARLLARCAIELMFSQDDERRHALADEAVAVARRVGDPLALDDVLTSAIPTNSVPWRMEVTLAYADELIELTASIDDPQRRALANLWSFVAHLNTGDVETADRHFAEAQRLDRELGQPTLRWLITVWTTFRRLMDGRLDDAERLATEALELGSRTGQPDAFTWYAAQLFELSKQRGQLAGLLETVQGEVADNPGLPAWQMALAVIHCAVGDRRSAQRVLDEMAPDGMPVVARDVLWLFAVAFLLDVAAEVGDVAKAEALYAAALPYRAWLVTSGVTYLGSAERFLATGASALGRYDDAVGHLEAALAFEERMRARPYIGLTCSDLARTLRLRGAPGDEERAMSYERRARDLAVELGSVYLERRLGGHFA